MSKITDERCQKVFDCISLALVSGFVAGLILLLIFIGLTIKKDYDKFGASPAWYTKEAWIVK